MLMKKFRNLVLAAVTVLFLGASVVPAAAATPSYASQYSWSGYKYNNNSYARSGSGYNYASGSKYATTYYGYKPAQTAPTVSKPASTTTSAAKPASTASITAEEQQMVNLVNKERTSRGLASLAVDQKLVTVARMKSQDMISKNYFGHQSPTYGSPFDLMKSQGITYRYAGENLAGADTVQRAHTNLMNSDGHRANILNANYTKIGIGVVHGGPYGLMISQEFTG
jgi:uncharacterized YkwD family protein